MKRISVLLFVLTASLAAVGQASQTKPYVITGFRPVQIDGLKRYEYTVKHGNVTLKVLYRESQVGISKDEWDANVKSGGKNLPTVHFYYDRDQGDISQVPELGTSLSACVLSHLSNGEKSIAIQPTPQPCMDQRSDSLTYLPFPNGPRLFDYVKFEIVSGRAATK